jgi:hypothetical protein
MKDGAVRLREIALAGDTLQLAPGLTAGMTIGADVATAEPPMVSAIWIGAEVRLGVDNAPTSAGEADEGRWEARRRGARFGPLFTGLTERFMDASRKRFGVLGALASGRGQLAGRLGYGSGSVGPLHVHYEADQHESNQEKLVKQQRRRHDEVPLPQG